MAEAEEAVQASFLWVDLAELLSLAVGVAVGVAH